MDTDQPDSPDNEATDEILSSELDQVAGGAFNVSQPISMDPLKNLTPILPPPTDEPGRLPNGHASWLRDTGR